MLDRLWQRTHLMVGPTGLTLGRSSALGRTAGMQLALLDMGVPLDGQGLPEALGRLWAEAGQRPGDAVHVWLDDSLVRLWTVSPPVNAGTWDDLLAAQTQRFVAVFDEPAAEWEMASPQDARRAYLACAVRRDLLNAIQQGLGAVECSAVSIMPDMAGVWNHWRRQVPSGYWLVRLWQDRLSIGRTAGSALTGWHVQAALRGGPASVSDAVAAVQRLADRLGVAAPEGLAWCGQGLDQAVELAAEGMAVRRLGGAACMATCLGLGEGHR